MLYRKPYIAMITATNAHLISMTSVSELEYIKFMLVAMKKIDKELFDDLHDQFVQLDPTGDGQITKSDLILLTKRKMKSSINTENYLGSVLGSKALCNPSPKKLIAMTVKNIIAPG